MRGTDLLLPADVARLFGVSPKTVVRWAQLGTLPAVRTLGGRRRFQRPVVADALRRAGHPVPWEQPTA